MIKKNLGQNIKAANAAWTFDNDVWENFDDHINNSIPLYQLCHKLGLEISDFFLEKTQTFLTSEVQLELLQTNLMKDTVINI